MPVLSNPKHEKFAQELAKGKTATDAYEAAGYAPHQPSASRLLSNAMVIARVAELQNKVAAKTERTLESIVDNLDKLRRKAEGMEKWGPSAVAAARACEMDIAKLLGHVVEKRENKNLSIDLTEAELERRIGQLRQAVERAEALEAGVDLPARGEAAAPTAH